MLRSRSFELSLKTLTAVALTPVILIQDADGLIPFRYFSELRSVPVSPPYPRPVPGQRDLDIAMAIFSIAVPPQTRWPSFYGFGEPCEIMDGEPCFRVQKEVDSAIKVAPEKRNPILDAHLDFWILNEENLPEDEVLSSVGSHGEGEGKSLILHATQEEPRCSAENDEDFDTIAFTTLRSDYRDFTEVAVGPLAFSSWPELGSALIHELESHAASNFGYYHLADMIFEAAAAAISCRITSLPLPGSLMFERQAYLLELSNSKRTGLSDEEKEDLQKLLDSRFGLKQYVLILSED